MIARTRSYRSFQSELQTILIRSGIRPHFLPVSAEAGKPENRINPDSDTYSVVGQVLIYMEEHMTESLSLEQLAEEARLSKYQLIRRFRDETGSTPWKYLTRRRIEKAKQLLEDGVPPAQVAAEAGFYDQSHLSKVFREETGLPPKEYQEKNFRNRN